MAARRAPDAPSVDEAGAAAVATVPLPGSGTVLSADQAQAVCRVLASDRAVDAIVGPAGMAGVRAAWESAFGPGSVVELAPSAAAAEVLADAVPWTSQRRTSAACVQQVAAGYHGRVSMRWQWAWIQRDTRATSTSVRAAVNPPGPVPVATQLVWVADMVVRCHKRRAGSAQSRSTSRSRGTFPGCL